MTVENEVIDTPVDDATPDIENPSVDETNADAANPEQPEEGGEGQEAKPDDEAKQHKSRTAKRIAELNHRAKMAEQRAAELEAKYAAQTAPASDKPIPDKFDSWAEYEDAKDSWMQAQAEKRVMEKLQASQPQQGQPEQQAQLQQSVSELRTQYSDFDDVLKAGLERANQVPLPVELDQLGLPQKDMFELAYTLSKDEDLYYELASMTAPQAMLKLGQVLANRAPSQARKPSVPNAQKPIKPTSANAPVKRDYFSQSDDEIMRSMNK